jgi:phage tail-like protein
MVEPVRDTKPPFLRLNAAIGWPLGPAASRPGIVSVDGPLKLAIAGAAAIAVNEPAGSFGGLRLPRGVAISSTGRIFAADPVNRVIWTAQGSSHEGPAVFAPLWPARPLPEKPGPKDVFKAELIPDDPLTLVRPTDIALLPDGDMAIADSGAERIIIIAYPTAQLRRVITIRGGEPTALVVGHDGLLYVADPKQNTIHRFDRFWRRDKTFPRASAKLASPAFLAIPANANGTGCDCACCCEGSAHYSPPVIFTIEGGSIIGLDALGYRTAVADPAKLVLSPPALVRVAADALTFADPAMPGMQPIRLTGISLLSDGRINGINVPLVAMPSRVPVPRSGGFVTTAMDGGRSGFAWDRLALQCDLPPNTRILVQTLTSDSSLEFDRVQKVPEEEWSVPLALAAAPGDPAADPVPELLVQSAAGRYLWLRFKLFSDGTRSPSISEIDVFAPRKSALRHLPASFHQDIESVRFLDRFLSYFDTVFAEISSTNRNIAAYFDPQAAPEGQFLDWLGSWFNLNFLAEWDEQTRRDMIATAMDYHAIRGTVQGLKKILQWHTGLSEPLPQIIEHFRVKTGSNPSIGGLPLDLSGVAHSATIVLPHHVAPDSEAQARLEKLIAKNAPAHVRINLRFFDAGIAIGTQSTIGIDTVVGSLDPQALGRAQSGLTLVTDAALQSGIASIRSAVPERSLSC